MAPFRHRRPTAKSGEEDAEGADDPETAPPFLADDNSFAFDTKKVDGAKPKNKEVGGSQRGGLRKFQKKNPKNSRKADNLGFLSDEKSFSRYGF